MRFIDMDKFELFRTEGCAEIESADPAKSVNSNFCRHNFFVMLVKKYWFLLGSKVRAVPDSSLR
jgi:hypothetical protein